MTKTLRAIDLKNGMKEVHPTSFGLIELYYNDGYWVNFIPNKVNVSPVIGMKDIRLTKLSIARRVIAKKLAVIRAMENVTKLHKSLDVFEKMMHY